MEAKRPFSQLDWLSTPEPVRAYIIHLERIIGQMHQRLELVEKRTEKLESRTEMKDESIKSFGQSIHKKLQLLCHWAKKPPNEKQWTEFYSELLLLLMLHEGADDPAGQLARSIGKQLESLWVFLYENGVEPTKNRSERALRFGVLWRKRSHGTQSEKCNRWVERILSLKQTCRMRALPVFPVLVKCYRCLFQRSNPGFGVDYCKITDLFL